MGKKNFTANILIVVILLLGAVMLGLIIYPNISIPNGSKPSEEVKDRHLVISYKVILGKNTSGFGGNSGFVDIQYVDEYANLIRLERTRIYGEWVKNIIVKESDDLTLYLLAKNLYSDNPITVQIIKHGELVKQETKRGQTATIGITYELWFYKRCWRNFYHKK